MIKWHDVKVIYLYEQYTGALSIRGRLVRKFFKYVHSEEKVETKTGDNERTDARQGALC